MAGIFCDCLTIAARRAGLLVAVVVLSCVACVRLSDWAQTQCVVTVLFQAQPASSLCRGRSAIKAVARPEFHGRWRLWAVKGRCKRPKPWQLWALPALAVNTGGRLPTVAMTGDVAAERSVATVTGLHSLYQHCWHCTWPAAAISPTLLLIGNVETNPGPPYVNCKSVQFARLVM